MREDGFYKATKGITSLEEVIRVVFHNEGDEMSPRAPEEIVALCEKVPTLIPDQDDSMPALSERSVQQAEASVSIIDSNFSVSDGEVYRIRFDVTTIETETDQIVDFFKTYQRVMQEMGKSLDSDLLGEFVGFIIYTVKRLEISLKSEFIEFFLRVKEREVKILVETLVPEKPSSSTFQTTRETGLRLINFLMPSSGIERALKTESSFMKRRGPYPRRPSLIGFLTQNGARQDEGEGPEIHDASYAKSSALYKKHMEELDLSGCLNK
jgi:hypothetical protein